MAGGITWGEIWTVLLAFLTVSGAGWAIWWRIAGQIKEVEKQTDGLEREFNHYKLHVAETFATKSGLTESMVSVTKAVTDMSERIDKRLDTMTDRLDRVIEANHKPVRRQN
jgi:hypothetical protein